MQRCEIKSAISLDDNEVDDFYLSYIEVPTIVAKDQFFL